jgi:predicted GNAT family N-acyltransferase
MTESELFNGAPQSTNFSYAMSKRMMAAHIDAYNKETGAYAVRQSVFIEELKCEECFLLDKKDAMAQHVIVNDGELVVGTGRIIISPDNTYIGRIAVIESYRGKSIGDLIVKMLIDKAFRFGIEPVKVYARLEVIEFYESIGFKKVSDTYIKEGVSIVEMDIMANQLRRKCD